jgi:Peptidase M15
MPDTEGSTGAVTTYIGLMRRLASVLALPLLVLAAPVPAQEVAQGQAEADYHAWLAREPAARAQVIAFRTYLQAKQIEQVVPTWQLVRTASMWRECSGPRFEVAPYTEWEHIARTLSFIRSHVEPVVGPVQAMSGYRNGALNQCSGGAPGSAHRHFYALDLVPLRPIDRQGMIRSLCRIHEWRGEGYEIGLGFYTGLRFHVDSKGFRRWGSDGRGATSPCVTAFG